MKAIARNIQVSPRKVRLVADSIRGMGVQKALNHLMLVEKHASGPLAKVVKSAMANAQVMGRDASMMMIGTVTVNEGAFLKRAHKATRGRLAPFKKRTSHVTILLKEGHNGK